MYQALYRKYRPAFFYDLSGQEHITSTLKNEIASNRIAHAYLFYGTRGTGKTSTARIFAKAVNCKNPKDGEPCGKCESCRLIADNESMDIIEIDAASNTGVDNIRDIRSEVLYTPAQSKYKVYIIDEVHMLSTGAFNAFLKTLENPPEHVIFILATTEVHKIMPTILSRCQRFDFKRIPNDDIISRLTYICRQENFEYEDEALIKIAQLSDGSLRDSISLLDQCSAQQGRVTKEAVFSLSGGGDDSLLALLPAIAANDPGRALSAFSLCYEHTPSVSVLCSDLCGLLRDMLVVKTVADPLSLIGNDPLYHKKLTDLADGFSLERIMYSLDVLADTLNGIQRAQNQRVYFEMSLIRLCDLKLALKAEALSARIGELERKLALGDFARAASPEPPPKEEAPPKRITQEQKTAADKAADISAPERPKQTQNPSSPPGQEPIKNWNEILLGDHGVKRSLSSLLIDSKAYISGGSLTVLCENPMAQSILSLPPNKEEFLQSVSRALARPLSTLIVTTKEEFDRKVRAEDPTDPFLDLLNENKERIAIQD